MSSDLLWIILGLAIIIAFIWYMRNRGPAPRGTYDDPDVRSGGSIGGGDKSYDDEDVHSGGSIGGDEDKAYDDPDYRSGGSIGGD